MAWEWDAGRYDALNLPHVEWGRRTLARLELTGTETVLDAACGTGRDTVALLAALPRGRVIAVDASAEMLARLRSRVAGLGGDAAERLTVVQADLTEPLPVGEPVDAVFSVAALHWIDDHQRLFENFAAVLRPGGQLVFDCGGRGNIARVNAAVQAVLGDVPQVWNFPDAEQTAARLAAAGFTDVETALVEDPARFADLDELCDYLETIVLGPHLGRLKPDERAAFVREIAGRLPDSVIDYVRLTARARRAG